eukprot:1176151-Prorocentrum_minimum.AAC.5
MMILLRFTGPPVPITARVHSPPQSINLVNMMILLRFTGPPVPITASMLSTPQRPFPFSHPVSSCANNGKGALNTPETLPFFSPSSPEFTSLGPEFTPPSPKFTSLGPDFTRLRLGAAGFGRYLSVGGRREPRRGGRDVAEVEVGEHQMARVREQDVLGLKVAVHVA